MLPRASGRPGVLSAGLIRRVLAIWLGLGFLLSALDARGFSEKTIERGRAFTVQIVSLDLAGEPVGWGSGFFISDEGHVATIYHVVKGAHRIEVRSDDPEMGRFELILIRDRDVELGEEEQVAS